jgi:hypothetical protein
LREQSRMRLLLLMTGTEYEQAVKSGPIRAFG